MKTATIIFEKGDQGAAQHRRSLCLDWLRLARMQRLQIQHVASLSYKGAAPSGPRAPAMLQAKEWQARFDIQYAGAAEEAWMKNLPLPEGAALEFSIRNSALPKK